MRAATVILQCQANLQLFANYERDLRRISICFRRKQYEEKLMTLTLSP